MRDMPPPGWAAGSVAPDWGVEFGSLVEQLERRPPPFVDIPGLSAFSCCGVCSNALDPSRRCPNLSMEELATMSDEQIKHAPVCPLHRADELKHRQKYRLGPGHWEWMPDDNHKPRRRGLRFWRRHNDD